jgi:TRAP transporter TAXI family solute receptor
MLRSLIVVLLAVLAAGCSRGPGGTELAEDVQARLDALFGRQVLLLRDLNRQGSAPYDPAPDGANQAIVYYNARLEFVEAYDPSDWEGLSPQLIATALGATDEGVVGLGAGSMAPGSELRAYGSIIYRREGDGWAPTDLRLAGSSADPASVEQGSRSRAHELIRRLSQVVETTPGLQRAEDEIVAEELDRALQNIELRLDTGKQGFPVATGPDDGEYARFIGSLATRFGGAGTLRVANTAGSVANAFMVDRGEARFGLVQSDVAAAAVTGDGLFATTGPLRHLRAVASLFPEPVHVIVREDSGIDSVAGLAGRRVSLGVMGSGTRHTAAQVLAAHGLESQAYIEVPVAGPRQALEQLSTGSLDAVVEVASAPWGQLSRSPRLEPFRILPLDPDAVARIEAAIHGLVPLVIPARTYPGQDQPIPTVAATALLVVNERTPDAIVTSVLETIFAASAAPGRGVSAARLSRERATVGVTIPLHDGAASYFESRLP